MNQTKKLFKIHETNVIRNIILRIVAISIVLLGIKSSFENNIAGKFIPPTFQSSNNTNELRVQKVTEKSISATQLNSTTDRPKKSHHGEDAIDDPNQNSTIQNSDINPTDYKTADDYLGSLFCTGCHRNCSLLNPQCGKGQQQASQAIQDFENSVNNTTENSDSSTSDDSTSDDINNFNSYANNNDLSITFIDNTNSLKDLFMDIIPIMGLYIAGTYYMIKFLTKKE